MSSDYTPPAGYVNPVPEPGEAKPRPTLEQARSIATAPIELPAGTSPVTVIRIIFGVIAVVFVLAGPIRHAIGSIPGLWPGDNSVKADGIVGLGSGAITAAYTPTGDERVLQGPHDGSGFTSQEWVLRDDPETIVVRDYRFSYSPVKDDATLEDYFATSSRDFFATVGHDVKPKEVTIDGRDGRIWETSGDTGGWMVLAEFPGSESTIRIRCNATSRESPVAAQCRQVLASMRIRG